MARGSSLRILHLYFSKNDVLSLLFWCRRDETRSARELLVSAPPPLPSTLVWLKLFMLVVSHQLDETSSQTFLPLDCQKASKNTSGKTMEEKFCQLMIHSTMFVAGSPFLVFIRYCRPSPAPSYMVWVCVRVRGRVCFSSLDDFTIPLIPSSASRDSSLSLGLDVTVIHSLKSEAKKPKKGFHYTIARPREYELCNSSIISIIVIRPPQPRRSGAVDLEVGVIFCSFALESRLRFWCMCVFDAPFFRESRLVVPGAGADVIIGPGCGLSSPLASTPGRRGLVLHAPGSESAISVFSFLLFFSFTYFLFQLLIRYVCTGKYIISFFILFFWFGFWYLLEGNE